MGSPLFQHGKSDSADGDSTLDSCNLKKSWIKRKTAFSPSSAKSGEKAPFSSFAKKAKGSFGRTKASSLKAGKKSLKNGGKLKPQSDRRKKLDAEYSRLRLQFLTQNPVCAVCEDAKATQVHHKKKRGKNYLNVETWLAICFFCHRYAHDNPDWAKEHGITEDSWK